MGEKMLKQVQTNIFLAKIKNTLPSALSSNFHTVSDSQLSLKTLHNTKREREILRRDTSVG